MQDHITTGVKAVPKRIIDRLRFKVAKSDLKNIGVKPTTWRRLRQIATDHEMTMDEVVQLLFKKAEEAEGKNGKSDAAKPDETAKMGDE